MAKPKNVKTGFDIENAGKAARITIVGEIGWWMTSGERFTELVNDLLAAGVEDVEGYVNTPGGSMFDANEIGNQIRRFPGLKICTVGSLCASAGTVLITYFDEVEASPNSQFMVHDPIMRPEIRRAADFDSNKQLYDNLRNDAIDRYVKQAKENGVETTPEEWSQAMEKVTWMNATGAKARGLIGSVGGVNDEQMPEDAAKVLRNIYEGLGREIPETVNLLTEEQEEPPKPPKNLNSTIDMEKETILKNRLILAFALTSVTEASALEDVVNAALARNKESVETITAIASACGVSLTAGENRESVVGKFAAALKAKDDKIAELEAAQKEDATAKMKAVLDIAEKLGKCTPEGRKKLEAIGEKSGVDALMDLLDTMPARNKLSDQLDDEESETGQNMSQMVYARLAKMEAAETKKS